MKDNDFSRKLHIFLGILGIATVVIFTLQNSEVVAINFLFWRIEMSRVILILVTLLIGFLLGYIFQRARK